MKDLTEKQKMFCKEYIVDLNGTQAAIRAGYSKKTANEQAARMLAKVNISTHIQRLLDKRSKKVEISAEYVINNIKNIGESCISSNDPRNALKAQELLGKHLKLFGADSEQTNNVTVVMPSIKTEDGVEMEFNIGSPIDSTDP